MAFYRDIKYRASDTADIQTLDNITFDGSSSYSLTRDSAAFTPSGASNILLSIDGVVQSGNFTITGSTIDFGVNVPATSECDFILHLGVGVINTPADGSVTNAKIANGAVSLDKLSATGTKDSTTFLRGDNTFATVNVGTNTPAFSVILSSNQTVAPNTFTKMNFNNVILDSDSAFNTTNKQFVVPSGKAGKYLIFGMVYRSYSANGTHMRAAISKNNSRVVAAIYTDGQGIAHTAIVSAVMDLAVGDTIHIDTYHSRGSDEDYPQSNNQFYGFRIGD